MGDLSTLKAAVQAAIRTNGNQEITGQVLQNTLTSIINTLGTGAQYMGIATPSTNPGTPDAKVFYIASANGTYSNFDGITVNNEVVILVNSTGNWVKQSTNLANLTTEEKSNLVTAINENKDKIAELGSKEDAFDYAFDFINNRYAPTTKAILLNNGSVLVNSGFNVGYAVTEFLPVSLFIGATFRQLKAWKGAQANSIAFYDKDKNVIGTAYTPTSTTTEQAVDIVLTRNLLSNYPNAEFIRLGLDLNYAWSVEIPALAPIDALNETIRTKHNDSIYAPWLQSTLEPNGTTDIKNAIIDIWFENTGNNTNFNSSDFQVKLGIFGVDSTTKAQITKIWVGVYLTNGGSVEGISLFTFSAKDIAVDPISKIGISSITAYGITMNIVVDVNGINGDISGQRIEGYYLMRNSGVNSPIIAFKKIYPTYVLPYLTKKHEEPYPSYKYNMFSKVLCAGDSVTKGFVVEGTQTGSTIYQEMPQYSYPTQLGKIHPNLDIDTYAQSGISATGWLNQWGNVVDFSQYDLMIFELGLNGYLNYNDLNVEGTNTNNYRKIIQKARQENANAVIALSRSSHFSGSWMPVLEYIAQENNCIVLDLKDTKYLNLDAQEMHGYYDAGGGQYEIDWAHFTRKGYNAKAYVISRLIAEQLSN